MARVKSSNSDVRMEKPHSPNKNRRLLAVVFVILFILGAFLALYPFVSDLIISKQQAEAVNQYNQYLNQLNQEDIDEQFKLAEEYNKTNDSESYYNALGLGESMCVVEIPSIEVKLPVYHGVSSKVLDFALGHIENSSLPVGGEDTHCIITGHTGLARVRILDDLINVKLGERFYIHVLGRTLTYQVDQIKVIEPNDMTYLQPEESKDYVTLLTCTPYGINSHRLIVRGTRVYDVSEDGQTDGVHTQTNIETPTETPDLTNAPRRSMVNFIWIASIVAFMFSLIVFVIILPKPNRSKTEKARKDTEENDEISGI